jgi:hypothetical protein
VQHVMVVDIVDRDEVGFGGRAKVAGGFHCGFYF